MSMELYVDNKGEDAAGCMLIHFPAETPALNWVCMACSTPPFKDTQLSDIYSSFGGSLALRIVCMTSAVSSGCLSQSPSGAKREGSTDRAGDKYYSVPETEGRYRLFGIAQGKLSRRDTISENQTLVSQRDAINKRQDPC